MILVVGILSKRTQLLALITGVSLVFMLPIDVTVWMFTTHFGFVSSRFGGLKIPYIWSDDHTVEYTQVYKWGLGSDTHT